MAIFHCYVSSPEGNLCVFWILVFTSFKFQTPGMAYLHSLQLRCCSMGDASPFMNLGHMMTAELLCHGGFQTWPSPKSSSWLVILNVRAKGLEHPKKWKGHMWIAPLLLPKPFCLNLGPHASEDVFYSPMFFANDSGLVKLCVTSVRLKRWKKSCLLQCSDSTSAVKQANRVETTYLLSKPNASAENLQVPLAEVCESPRKIARAEGQSLQLQMVLIRPWGPKGRKMCSRDIDVWALSLTLRTILAIEQLGELMLPGSSTWSLRHTEPRPSLSKSFQNILNTCSGTCRFDWPLPNRNP